MLEILKKEDYVICPICGKKLSYINNFHLRCHGYGTESEFLKDYPDTKLTSDTCKSKKTAHIMSLNANSELQATKARNGWSDERRKEKSDQMKQVSYELHNSDKYKATRAVIYKNRYGNPKKFRKNDGSVIGCRSKLEWDIALFLSQNNIEFEYETLQIKYVSPKDGRVHQYIPDYYLKTYNLIIEGKYSNEKDLPTVISKKDAAEKCGYKFIFVDEILIGNRDELISLIESP